MSENWNLAKEIMAKVKRDKTDAAKLAELQIEFDRDYGKGSVQIENGGDIIRLVKETTHSVDGREEHIIGVPGLTETFLAIGSKLYQQGEDLGRGGFGAVFTVIDEDDNRFAVKEERLRVPPTAEALGSLTPEASFLAERGELHGQKYGSQNLYTVMTYYPGINLANITDKMKPSAVDGTSSDVIPLEQAIRNLDGGLEGEYRASALSVRRKDKFLFDGGKINLADAEDGCEEGFITDEELINLKAIEAERQRIVAEQAYSETDRINFAMLALDELYDFFEARNLHRDIKGANFVAWINPDGTYAVKMVDFGQSIKLAPDEVSREEPLPSGTPGYWAPEVERSLTMERRLEFAPAGARERPVAIEPGASVFSRQSDIFSFAKFCTKDLKLDETPLKDILEKGASHNPVDRPSLVQLKQHFMSYEADPAKYIELTQPTSDAQVELAMLALDKLTASYEADATPRTTQNANFVAWVDSENDRHVEMLEDVRSFAIDSTALAGGISVPLGNIGNHLAPEVAHAADGEVIISKQSDAYSFALFCTSNLQLYKTPLNDIFEKCLAENPADRPSLEQLKQHITLYQAAPDRYEAVTQLEDADKLDYALLALDELTASIEADDAPGTARNKNFVGWQDDAGNHHVKLVATVADIELPPEDPTSGPPLALGKLGTPPPEFSADADGASMTARQIELYTFAQFCTIDLNLYATPLRGILEKCSDADPAQRPSLEELKQHIACYKTSPETYETLTNPSTIQKADFAFLALEELNKAFISGATVTGSNEGNFMAWVDETGASHVQLVQPDKPLAIDADATVVGAPLSLGSLGTQPEAAPTARNKLGLSADMLDDTKPLRQPDISAFARFCIDNLKLDETPLKGILEQCFAENPAERPTIAQLQQHIACYKTSPASYEISQTLPAEFYSKHAESLSESFFKFTKLPQNLSFVDLIRYALDSTGSKGKRTRGVLRDMGVLEPKTGSKSDARALTDEYQEHFEHIRGYDLSQAANDDMLSEADTVSPASIDLRTR